MDTITTSLCISLCNISLLIICTLFHNISLANSLNFHITRFLANETKVVYQGDAEPSLGAVELINKIDYFPRVGHVVSAKSLRLWDARSKELSDFTTHFSFSIDTLGAPNYGHGFAFFLAPAGFQIPFNSTRGFLGLFNTTPNSLSNRIVLVEFDSFPNPEWDPSFEHVGINNNSLTSAVYTPWNTSFHSGDVADAWINYNSSTKNLSVSWTYQNTSNAKENTSLYCQIDLMKMLPEWVVVGFSAATGQYAERNTLYSWEFTSTLDAKGTDKGNNVERKRRLIGLTVSAGVLTAGLIITFSILLFRRKLKKKKVDDQTFPELKTAGSEGPTRFSYGDLASATNNFSDQRKLGQGGFGAVYRGYLVDLDVTVAVKKISKGSKQGIKEYRTEVKVISSLRHRNLVQLIGWCHDRGEFLLVYEFMPNGSLDSHLFGKRYPLTWAMRYKISLGLASSLLYLHEGWEQCVVHRDVKPSNIMLDSSFNVKLGDFGLAKLMDHELGPQTTGLAGTLGYLAPEYISTGRAGKESDVYSFGVVALEIATGRRSFDHMAENDFEMGLVERVWELYGKGNLLLGVDERLAMDFDQKQVECLMIVGLFCAHPDPSLRPSIRQAISVLKFESSLPNLPTKMPVPIFFS
ncbi:hypothetical protein FNV43_RR10613 [Rhamnella rubrinervis]|uniref:Protein kinase domain-containing protein n=1 Tax=Rhamnella rubrinervis TaxID=2594499 RepID=A0A8K0H470_9ROSA|nr:hypothetical protein FNV43_RR10613 [Rhamnella rubrinervis]